VANTIVSDVEGKLGLQSTTTGCSEDFVAGLVDDMHSLRSSLRSMESTNQFLMMIINRVIDCNKVSHGIALVSQQETIDLKDALQMPIDSIRDLHNTDVHGRVEIVLSDISDGICQHIITDKQWLQENMLCLLSNAVKFSVGGKVRISVSVCRQSATPSVHRTLRQFSRSTSNSSFRLTSSARVPNSSVIERSSVSLRGFPAVDSEREISNHSLSADSETLLLFQVEDSGIGLNEAAMSKLFEPFAQAQRMTGGTGLGLYSLAKRTLSLGGKYGVYNRSARQAQGSVFWFAIPYVPDYTATAYVVDIQGGVFSRKEVLAGLTSMRLDPLSPTVTDGSGTGANCSTKTTGPAFSRNSSNSVSLNKFKILGKIGNMGSTDITTQRSETYRSVESELPSPAGPAVCGSAQGKAATLRVLVVDDSMAILKMTTMMLRRKGFSVTTAENGLLALNILNASTDRFDVILLDLQMPVMDGLECTRRIREMESSRLPEEHADPDGVDTHNEFIVGVSANSDHDTVIQAYEAGVDLFISKPFTMDSFFRAVNKMESKE
jgi:CheY-like chemotaxis protein